MQDKFLEKIFDWLWKRKWLAVPATILALLFLIHSDRPTWTALLSHTTTAWQQIRTDSLVLPGVALAIAMYAGWAWLVRKSNAVWLRDNEGPHERRYSSTGTPCNVDLVENWLPQQEGWVCQVQVENTSQALLEHVQGRVRIVCNGLRTNEVPFTVDHLEPGMRAVASDRVQVEGLIDYFDALLDKVKGGGWDITREVQRGCHIGHNFTRLMNMRLRRAYWPRRLRYETTWAERKLRHVVKMTKFYALPQRFYIGTGRRAYANGLERLHSLAGHLGLSILFLCTAALVLDAVYGVVQLAWQFGRAWVVVALSALERALA